MPKLRKRMQPLKLSKRHQAVLAQEERVEPDVHFWLVHVVHWHAFLVVVIAVVYYGYSGRW